MDRKCLFKMLFAIALLASCSAMAIGQNTPPPLKGERERLESKKERFHAQILIKHPTAFLPKDREISLDNRLTDYKNQLLQEDVVWNSHKLNVESKNEAFDILLERSEVGKTLWLMIDNHKFSKSSTIEYDGPNNPVILLEYTIDKNENDQNDVSYSPHITKSVITYIELDKKLKNKQVKSSEPIRVPTGVIERKREEYTVTHSVGVQDGFNVGGEAGLNWAIIKAEIRLGIEHQTNRTYGESKTTAREVEIVGGNEPVELIWLEQFRTGKATTIVNARKYEIPFEFPEGWDLQAKKIHD